MTARHRRRALLAAPGTHTTTPTIAVVVSSAVALAAALVMVLVPTVGSADTGDVAPASDVVPHTDLTD